MKSDPTALTTHKIMSCKNAPQIQSGTTERSPSKRWKPKKKLPSVAFVLRTLENKEVQCEHDKTVTTQTCDQNAVFWQTSDGKT